MRPVPAIVEPAQIDVDECMERIRRIMAPGLDPRAYHLEEAKRLRAKAAAARERIGDLLRTARTGLDDEQWSGLLKRASLTAADAEAYMLGQAAPATAPVDAPATPVEQLAQLPVRVYFIQAVSGGPIKIGMSQNPERRLADLQVGSPVMLRIIGAAAGGQSREAALHRRLAKYRLHGEWFADAPEVLAAIAEVLQ